MLPILALAILVAEPAQGARIVGTVREADSSRPLAGAAVLLPDLDRGTLADSSGRYELADLPPGPHHLVVRMIGYVPHALHALVPRAGELEINVSLRPAPIPVAAAETRAPILMRGVEPGTTVFPDREVSTTAIANHPLLAEPDGFRALGGGDVVLNPETTGGVHIRGGAADQTAFMLDGVPILSPYHSAGLASAWNTDALSRLYLRSGEPSASAAHALSGIIEGITREPGSVPRSWGSISTTQSRLTVDGPIGRGGYLVSARGGLHDLVAPRDERSYLGGGTGDVLAKLAFPLPSGRLEALYYGNINRIGTEAAPDTVNRPRNRFDWDGSSFGLQWRRRWSHAEAHVLGWNAGGDASAEWAMPVGRILMESDHQDRGLVVGWQGLADSAITRLELRLTRSRTAYQTTPDRVESGFGLRAMTSIATLEAHHGRPLGGGLDLDLTTAASLVEGVVRLAPAARLHWSAEPHLSLTGAYFRTHQYTQPLRNDESVIGHVFPPDVDIGVSAAGIPVPESDQGVIAADWRPWAGVRVGLEAYERRSRSLVLVAPRDGEPFTTGGYVIGSGGARGLAIELAAGAARWGALASYGWQRVRYCYGDSSYVPDYGAAHLLEGGLVVFPSATSSVRLGCAAAMGRRVTMIPGQFEWESCNLTDRGCEFVGSPHYGDEPLGGLRLPAYARVDLGVRQHWHVTLGGRDGLVALFGTYSNLLGRKNLLTYALDPATGDRVGIELRPAALLVVGLDWRY